MADKRRHAGADRGRLTIRFDPPTIEEIERAAASDRRRVADWVRVTILRELDVNRGRSGSARKGKP